MQVVKLTAMTAVGNSDAVAIDAPNADGMLSGFAVYATGTGTTPSWIVQVSPNNVDWFDSGSAVTTVPGQSQQTAKALWVRVKVTAGTALNVTLYVLW